MRHALLVFVPLLLAACPATYRGNEDSPYYAPPAGSRLILKRELAIPAGSAHVTLQGGRAVNGSELDQYRPHCLLEVLRVSDSPQTVAADEFRVTRVRQDMSTAMRANVFRVRSLAGDTGLTFVNYRTVMDLQSSRQPQVRWLTCQQWGDPALHVHVSVNEMRKALGDWFTLETPRAPGGH
jgi:hypothetical protein